MIQPLHITFSVIVGNNFKCRLIENSVVYCKYWSTRWFSRSLPSTVTLAWPDSRPPAVLVSQLYSCPSYTSTLLILRVPLLNSLKRESCREEKEVSFNVKLSEATKFGELSSAICIQNANIRVSVCVCVCVCVRVCLLTYFWCDHDAVAVPGDLRFRVGLSVTVKITWFTLL